MNGFLWYVFLSALWFLPAPAHSAEPRVKRVIHVVFENADFKDAVAQPAFSRLARAGVLFTRSRGVTHPSQPNYIAMTAGSTLGVKLNREVTLDAGHLGDLFEQKGLSWAAYAEDYPGDCFLGMRSGKYVRKHVPFLSFKNVQEDPARCARVRTGDDFFADYEKGLLPEYAFFTPNMDQCGHDTSPRHASEWFQNRFAPVLNDAAFMKESLLLLTYDESERYWGDQRILTLLVGANVRPGLVVKAPVDHYTFLRLIEEIFQLGSLNRNDSKAKSLPQIWF